MIEIFTQADLKPFRPSDLEQLFKFVPAQPPMLAEFELEAEHIYLAINKDGAWLRLPKCDLYGADFESIVGFSLGELDRHPTAPATYGPVLGPSFTASQLAVLDERLGHSMAAHIERGEATHTWIDALSPTGKTLAQWLTNSKILRTQDKNYDWREDTKKAMAIAAKPQSFIRASPMVDFNKIVHEGVKKDDQRRIELVRLEERARLEEREKWEAEQAAKKTPIENPDPRQQGNGKDEVETLKKKDLIIRFRPQWQSIENDLKETSKKGYEGLQKARIRRGVYDVNLAIDWAKSNGRWEISPNSEKINLMQNLPVSKRNTLE